MQGQHPGWGTRKRVVRPCKESSSAEPSPGLRPAASQPGTSALQHTVGRCGCLRAPESPGRDAHPHLPRAPLAHPQPGASLSPQPSAAACASDPPLYPKGLGPHAGLKQTGCFSVVQSMDSLWLTPPSCHTLQCCPNRDAFCPVPGATAITAGCGK